MQARPPVTPGPPVLGMKPIRRRPPNVIAGEGRATPTVSNVTVALGVLDSMGGSEGWVDIEDVAAQAFAIAPDRFGWRTRPWASWERVRTAFVHANQDSARRNRSPLVTASQDGNRWRLTAEGVRAVRAVGLSQGTGRAPAVTRRGSTRSAERVRQIRRHSAFQRFANGAPASDIERFQIADLLLCPPDSAADAVRRKLDLAKAAAVDSDDKEVGSFLHAIEAEVDRQWS